MTHQDPEKRREYHREYMRDWREANLEKVRGWDRRPERLARMRARAARRRHGAGVDGTFAAMWKAQDGRCYLCSDPLQPERAVIDHDHRHCSAEYTCCICRRGLACGTCNTAIGLARDDPARLRRMADALEAAQLEVEHRKAAAGASEQLLLIE